MAGWTEVKAVPREARAQPPPPQIVGSRELQKTGLARGEDESSTPVTESCSSLRPLSHRRVLSVAAALSRQPALLLARRRALPIAAPVAALQAGVSISLQRVPSAPPSSPEHQQHHLYACSPRLCTAPSLRLRLVPDARSQPPPPPLSLTTSRCHTSAPLPARRRCCNLPLRPSADETIAVPLATVSARELVSLLLPRSREADTTLQPSHRASLFLASTFCLQPPDDSSARNAPAPRPLPTSASSKLPCSRSRILPAVAAPSPQPDPSRTAAPFAPTPVAAVPSPPLRVRLLTHDDHQALFTGPDELLLSAASARPTYDTARRCCCASDRPTPVPNARVRVPPVTQHPTPRHRSCRRCSSARRPAARSHEQSSQPHRLCFSLAIAGAPLHL
ncbi:flocculation protein FLO11-like [Eucalyptus grandis]|uniref:flocculation protein FLO11-like n=1 Tax=Eucalyptus grandis TaxID=71139 RepID=UPI00192E8E6E|nr:flocculation protein FLO11-like [Eucalyptus grandis]